MVTQGYRRRRARTSERDFKQAMARIIGRLPDGAPISVSEMARLPGVNAGLLRELERIQSSQYAVVDKAAMENKTSKWGRGKARAGLPSKPWSFYDSQGRPIPLDPAVRDAIKRPFNRRYAETRAATLSSEGRRVSAEERARGRQVLRVEPPGARSFIESVRAPKSRIEDRTAMSHRRAAERAARHGDAAAAADHKRHAANAARRANTARKAGK